MKKIGWLVAGVLLVSSAACDKRPTHRRDAGVARIDAGALTDAGHWSPLDAPYPTYDAPPTVHDAFAPGSDAFVPGSDAFVPGTDAFVPGTDAFVPTADAHVATDAYVARDAFVAPPVCGDYPGVDTYDVPPIPSSCMPRCTSATLTRINGCPADDTGDCLYDALDDDTTPSRSMTIGGGSAVTLDCGFCFDLQRFSCFSDVCPYSAAPYLLCDSATDADGCAGERSALSSCLDTLSVSYQAYLDDCFNSTVLACFNTTGGFLPASVDARHLIDVSSAIPPRR